MVFQDIFLNDLLLILSIIFYISNTNVMMLLYTSGIYLIILGILLLINDSDIYTGFLWVIDLGVGLVFFIFILHFTSFLFQKSTLNLTFRHFLFFYSIIISAIMLFYYYANPVDNGTYGDLNKIWQFKLSYLDYYMILNSNEVTDLNTLRDTYFVLNTFEFYVVNFSLFYGLVASIILCFLVQRIFNFLNYSQIINAQVLKKTQGGFFIRNQNFMTQQNTSATVRAWIKTKKKFQS